MALEAIDRLTEEQIGDLHRLYQSEWWTRGREIADVRRMLAHSDVIIAFCDSDTKQLVAFARILTDTIYKALILDVIVEPSCRGQGLGRLLMGAILEHPATQSVQHLELYCLPDMLPFYRRWGFTDDLGGLGLMRRYRVPNT